MAVNKLLQKQQNVCVPISVARKIESKAKENGWGYSRTVRYIITNYMKEHKEEFEKESGMINKNNTVQQSVAFPKSMHNALKRQAAEYGVGISALIRMILADWLKKNTNTKKEK